MHQNQALLALAGLLATTSAQFLGSLVNSVCYPSGQLKVRDTKYPCPLLNEIKTVCKANGTSPEHLKAHRDCMCDGSYMDEEFGCLECLTFHAFRGEYDRKHFRGVLSAASKGLCGQPTPTADWDRVWQSADAANPYTYRQEGNELINKGVGRTEVEIYYNATRSQGPGHFTPVPASLPASASASASALTRAPLWNTTAQTSTPAVRTETPTTVSLNDAWFYVQGRVEVTIGAQQTRLQPPGATPAVENLPQGDIKVVTVVQIYVAKCCGVQVGTDFKLACTNDMVVPGTGKKGTASNETLAALPAFPKNLPTFDPSERQRDQLAIPIGAIQAVAHPEEKTARPDHDSKHPVDSCAEKGRTGGPGGAGGSRPSGSNGDSNKPVSGSDSCSPKPVPGSGSGSPNPVAGPSTGSTKPESGSGSGSSSPVPGSDSCSPKPVPGSGSGSPKPISGPNTGSPKPESGPEYGNTKPVSGSGSGSPKPGSGVPGSGFTEIDGTGNYQTSPNNDTSGSGKTPVVISKASTRTVATPLGLVVLVVIKAIY